MGRCYIKIDKDHDAYAEWSSVVDSVVAYGTREDMIKSNLEWYGRSNETTCLQALDRADEHGTSARDGGPGHLSTGAWDDEELLIMEGGGPGHLKRADLQRYCELTCIGDVEPDWAEVAKLITPFPDDYYD